MKTRRRSLIACVALLFVVALLVSAGGTSHAALGPVLAGPGSAATTYYTPRVVMLKGQSLNFRNLDVAMHDVRNAGGKFFSALIGFGKQTPVVGVKTLAKGTYSFFCSLHPNMKGQLIVR